MKKTINKVKGYLKEHEEEIKVAASCVGWFTLGYVGTGLIIDNHRMKKTIRNTVRVVRDVSIETIKEGKKIDDALELLKTQGKEGSEEYRDLLCSGGYLLGLMKGAQNTAFVLLEREDLIK